MFILAGAFATAEELFREIDEMADATRQIWIKPQVYRLRAALMQRVGDEDAAERWLDRSFAQARDHGETYFELCAARDLGRLYAARGEHQRAREFLATVCGKFTESAENLDLREARALLRPRD
jgi:tetratricopeptide (TPR) repeat protein